LPELDKIGHVIFPLVVGVFYKVVAGLFRIFCLLSVYRSLAYKTVYSEGLPVSELTPARNQIFGQPINFDEFPKFPILLIKNWHPPPVKNQFQSNVQKLHALPTAR